MTGKLDDIDQRRLIILLGIDRLFRPGGYRRVFRRRAQRQPHGQPHPLLDDGPLQENALAVGRNLTRNNPVRDVFHLGQVTRLIVIRQFCHFGKDRPADIVNRCMYASHSHNCMSPDSRFSNSNTGTVRMLTVFSHTACRTAMHRQKKTAFSCGFQDYFSGFPRSRNMFFL